MAADSEARQENNDRRDLAAAGVAVDESSLLAVIARREDRDVMVSAAAIRMASRLSKSSALIAGLSDVVATQRPAAIVLVAADALRKLGDSTSVPTIIGRVQNATDSRDRFTLAMALARAGRGDGWPVLVESLTSDPDS